MSELPLVLADVARWYAVSALALGERSGLLAALMDGPASATELAHRAQVDPDNARTWASTMVVAGYASADAGRFAAREEALGMLRGGAPFDVRAVVELLVPLGGMLPRVAQAIRDGAGIGSDEVQAAVGTLAERVNGPMYARHLVDDWIAGHPDVDAALRAGIDVAEIGPGGGTALRLLASAFPASRFAGFDIDPAQVERANRAAVAAGLANLRFDAVDAAGLPAAAFDLLCVFDAFHHMTAPGPVIAAIGASLRPGGWLLIAEPLVAGDLAVDAADPFAVLTYASDLLYCYQESKVAGAAGLGATWAASNLDAFLAGAGFEVLAVNPSDAGYTVTLARPTGT